MNKHTARVIQGVVQAIFYFTISACIMLSPGIAGTIIGGA